jgi:PAS domain S-box-containing protein
MDRVIPEVFDDLEIGITLHDPETGEIVSVNDRLTELYGYTKDELREMSVSEYSVADSEFTQEMARERIQAAAGGEPQTFEWHVRRADGSSVWVRVRLARTMLGEEAYVISEIRDITERKERERDLVAERELVEQSLNTIDDIFYLIDPSGRLERWNDTLAEFTGYTDEELDGIDALEFFVDEDQEVVGEAIADVLREGSAVVEADLQNSDGEAIPFEFTGARFTDSDGQLRGVIGIGRNVAERIARERELREQREILAQISESIGDVIWIRSPDEGEMEFVSEAYETVWGRSLESLYDEPFSFVEAVHEDDRQRVLDALEEQERHPERYDETYRVVQPEGEIRWVHDRAFGVREAGELTRIVGIASDITESKKHERQLERSNERLQRFAYVLSHDLQEPLRMVSSYIELLETELDDQLDEETREYMEFAADGAERMQAMIDGLLQYARVETRGEEFELTDLDAVLEDVQQDLEMKLAEADVTIHVDTLPRVSADVQQLRQLFQNLLKNAADHGGAGTTVEITANTTGDTHEISITDDGPGIPPERQDDILGLFETGEDSDGTGIGLAVCERIADRHGGEIRVDSTPGEGTTFVVTLPKHSRSE